MKKNWCSLFMCGLFLVVLNGCAHVDREVSLLYTPVANARLGKGEIVIGASHTNNKPAGTDVRWIIGKVKNSDGETAGNIYSTMAPEDILMDAFEQELRTAGYSVTQVSALPTTVKKGIFVPKMTLSLEEESGLVKGKASSTLNVAVDLWKNGQKIRQLSYESRVSDIAVRDRDLLAQQVLEKSLQEIMKQAVPEIVSALER